jgi:predicted MFS family arabinose efflux permease
MPAAPSADARTRPQPAQEASGGSASIAILAVAAFVIVTTEFLIVGLLPALARDLRISVATAGQLVTLFAVVVMLCGPLLTASLAHLERKRLFIAILVIFALSNALAAVAWNIWVLAVARLVPALALPVFWGTASETAAQIAGPQKSGRAVSTVYLGISAAMLFGIPLGTLVSRGRGLACRLRPAGAAVIAGGRADRRLRAARAPAATGSMAAQARILKSRFFLANVALSVLVFTAMFTGYTYLAEMLEKSAGIAPRKWAGG